MSRLTEVKHNFRFTSDAIKVGLNLINYTKKEMKGRVHWSGARIAHKPSNIYSFTVGLSFVAVSQRRCRSLRTARINFIIVYNCFLIANGLAKIA